MIPNAEISFIEFTGSSFVMYLGVVREKTFLYPGVVVFIPRAGLDVLTRLNRYLSLKKSDYF